MLDVIETLTGVATYTACENLGLACPPPPPLPLVIPDPPSPLELSFPANMLMSFLDAFARIDKGARAALTELALPAELPVVVLALASATFITLAFYVFVVLLGRLVGRYHAARDPRNAAPATVELREATSDIARRASSPLRSHSEEGSASDFSFYYDDHDEGDEASRDERRRRKILERAIRARQHAIEAECEQKLSSLHSAASELEEQILRRRGENQD